MEKELHYYLEIGAGGAERVIRDAEQYPERHYVVIDLDEPKDIKRLPGNIRWFFGGITKKRGIPIPDGEIDEVNIDYVLGSIYGDAGYEESAERILQEAARVLQADGKMIIREPKYMVDNIVPIVEKLNLEYEALPMPLEEAKQHSESIKEAAREFEDGYIEMEPYLITVEKKKSS